MQTFAKLPHSSPRTTANAYAIGDAADASSSPSTYPTVARLTAPVEKAKTREVSHRTTRLATIGATIGATGAIAIAACGRSQGVSDDRLGGLVVEVKQPDAPVEVDLAAKETRELGRALGRPQAIAIAALGPHTTRISTTNAVTEGGRPSSALDDLALIELGDGGAYHALYNNS